MISALSDAFRLCMALVVLKAIGHPMPGDSVVRKKERSSELCSPYGQTHKGLKQHISMAPLIQKRDLGFLPALASRAHRASYEKGA
ncbi:hypothetical protein D5086_018614 [Populus alba]|uniref:Uncharacterized protein n=1 Tax=Populus alba TaxID=43335 RepID=A0ACC4BRQ9_POPAL